MREIKVAVIGTKFMGRAHANAYRQARAFFSPPALPVLSLACGTNEHETQKFAEKFGFFRYTTNWEEAAQDPEIDVVDICTPNDLHAPITFAAARKGKAVFCEKPLARDLEEAKGMLRAVEEAGVPHMICFNYRFFPAIQLAKKLISDGALGEIRQFHALYLQDWGLTPGLPLTWRFQRERAGSGALGDTAVHIVDLARFLVGEIAEVTGLLATFIPERPLPSDGMGKVTVDDAAAFLARFQSGATGIFETSRVSLGRKNFMHLEVNGSRGSLFWNAEDPNWLWFYSIDDPPHLRGFRRILVTEEVHPYTKNWWPTGHILGYEHSFTHAVVELCGALREGRNPQPNFLDGVEAQAVLEAVLLSEGSKRWEKVPR
ncbi:Gfo/Idh/MocA family oxidoreductase [Candidatus Bipolaricaulota bacterium]|nr:Gfo/Idh/MocA family oxidoreductase [Candidatus Bipolaricaulota bacterium]